MHKFLKTALVVGGLAAAGGAHAATATTTYLVSATVNTNCITTATPMAFTPYSPGSGLVNQTSTVSVRCTNGTGYTVGMDAGLFAAATVTTRRMANGAAPLSYALYRDAALSQNWGNTPGTDTESGTGTGMAVASAFTVYGQIPDAGANLLATAGSYVDTITVNVNY